MKGYGATLTFKGDTTHVPTINPSDGHIDSQYALMDAADYRGRVDMQYEKAQIIRDLDKVISALNSDGTLEKLDFATGIWGCGVFKESRYHKYILCTYNFASLQGDNQLKFFLQWLACTICDRDMLFSTFKMTTKDLTSLEKFYVSMSENGMTLRKKAEFLHYKRNNI